LFFLDYIATGKVSAEKVADIVKGIADGCVLAECALVGGETAEMPDFYQDGEYDMAGFAVGVVDKKKIIDGSKIIKNNVIIGISSSGIHSNGYSLVRKLFFDELKMNVLDRVKELNMTLGEALITPTKIYTKLCNSVLAKKQINGIVHITGGGFFENIPRIIPEGLGAEIKMGSWKAAPIFDYIQKMGDIETIEMFATFNMGIGMMMVVDQADAVDVIKLINASGENAYEIGRIIEGKGVTLC
jgi:phosphoribosylformylglycinamidine cyclo-ligase